MEEHKPTGGLSYEAYEEIPGDQYNPYIPKDKTIPEFTWKAVILGTVLGVLFAVANAYIGLKVGLTISSSIPVAVMSIAIFRVLKPVFGKATILENNISQTVGSAGTSLASGVIFTIPALILWKIDPSLLMMFTVAIFGGLLGVLFMIPLRRYLINREHGRLPYPEGTACAEVLVAGETGGAQAKHVFLGLVIGGIYKVLMSAVNLWHSDPVFQIPRYKNAVVSFEVTPALLGVGYILGYRISAVMVGGSLISWVILIPLISMFGSGLSVPFFPETAKLIADMSPNEIWNRYIRYIGAGAVAFGGVSTLIKALPTISQSIIIGFKETRERLKNKLNVQIRTDWDIPLGYVLIGALLIVILLSLLPFIPAGIKGGFFIVIFAFFFVAVSARITGLIGSSSNPISGMTIATLLATSLVFVLLGWTDESAKVIVLTVGGVVCIASAIGGDTSQDLKTGFLVGATPWKQQIGLMIGVLSSSLFIGLVILQLHKTMVIGSNELPAPQATLMSIVIDGVLTAKLPWELILIGISIGIVVELLGIPTLALAVGLYLPLSTMTPIFIGGVLRWFCEKRSKPEELKENRERGVLFGSGLIAGDGLVGVGIAFYLGLTGLPMSSLPSFYNLSPVFDSRIFSMLIFGVLGYFLYKSVFSKSIHHNDHKGNG